MCQIAIFQGVAGLVRAARKLTAGDVWGWIEAELTVLDWSTPSASSSRHYFSPFHFWNPLMMRPWIEVHSAKALSCLSWLQSIGRHSCHNQFSTCWTRGDWVLMLLLLGEWCWSLEAWLSSIRVAVGVSMITFWSAWSERRGSGDIGSRSTCVLKIALGSTSRQDDER